MMTVLLTVAALVTATISGMAGLGGGTVLVAIFFAVGLAPGVAVPVHAAVQLVSNGARTVAFLRHVDLRAVGIFVLGGAPAPFLVADLVKGIDPDSARLFMGLFILAITWGADALKRVKLYGAPGLVAAGVLAGGLGMVVGATGTLIAPFFLRPQWSKETVIGTKALCQALAHVFKIVAFSQAGFAFAENIELIAPMAIAVVAGTFIGKRIVGLMSEETFRLLFRVILTALAIKLIVFALL